MANIAKVSNNNDVYILKSYFCSFSSVFMTKMVKNRFYFRFFTSWIRICILHADPDLRGLYSNYTDPKHCLAKPNLVTEEIVIKRNVKWGLYIFHRKNVSHLTWFESPQTPCWCRRTRVPPATPTRTPSPASRSSRFILSDLKYWKCNPLIFGKPASYLFLNMNVK